jgi:hypothetical protein
LIRRQSPAGRLAARHNAQVGFGSTQDTVVALEALTAAAVNRRSEVDATVTLKAGSWSKEVRVAADNADVVQVVEVPIGPNPDPGTTPPTLAVETRGNGQVMVQAVRRYNVRAPEAPSQQAFQSDVRYDTTSVAVNDLITITAPSPSPRRSQSPRAWLSSTWRSRPASSRSPPPSRRCKVSRR